MKSKVGMRIEGKKEVEGENARMMEKEKRSRKRGGEEAGLNS